MATKTLNHNLEVYTIKSSDGKTQMSFVPAKGAAGNSFVVQHAGKERELLFIHDHFWDLNSPHLPGGWPFLFPICARIERDRVAGNYLYDGHLYNMPIHGIAAYFAWQVTDASKPDSITLQLTDTPKSRAQYPFSFKIELTYIITANQLICKQKYTNTGDKPLPYYAGFHPYFLTPQPGQGKEKVILDYQPVRHFQYNVRMTDLIGEQPLFKTPIAVTSPEIHEQLVLLGENKLLTLIYPDGLKMKMQVLGTSDKDLFSYAQVYSPDDQPFVCVEPWMSFPNALNTVSGVRWLKPQQCDEAELSLMVTT